MKRLDIIYEDNHLLVVNKPGGLLVQGDKTHDETLMDLAKSYIKDKYNKPGDVFLGLPHRIDRVTSGLVILCRTSKALSRVTIAFSKGQIKKKYLCVTPQSSDIPNSGTLTNYLWKDRMQNKSQVISKDLLQKFPGYKEAILKYNLVGKLGKDALYMVNLITGRHHQIRVQFAHKGISILGDKKYLSPVGYGHYIGLHAWKIEFVHPVKKEPLILTGYPPDLKPWPSFKSLIKNKLKSENES